MSPLIYCTSFHTRFLQLGVTNKKYSNIVGKKVSWSIYISSEMINVMSRKSRWTYLWKLLNITSYKKYEYKNHLDIPKVADLNYDSMTRRMNLGLYITCHVLHNLHTLYIFPFPLVIWYAWFIYPTYFLDLLVLCLHSILWDKFMVVWNPF